MSIVRQCQICGDILTDIETEESHRKSAYGCEYMARTNVSMKPLLGVAVTQALHRALIDSAAIYDPDNADCTNGTRLPTPEEREAWVWDIYAIPLTYIDPEALAQNLCVRLLGGGGWHVGGVYSGNATPREVFEASVDRPDRDSVSEVAFDLGTPPEER